MLACQTHRAWTACAVAARRSGPRKERPPTSRAVFILVRI